MTLPDFEQHPVRRARHKLKGTGDGLSKAMAAEPIAYTQGDRVVFAVEAICDDIGHPRITGKDETGDDIERVHVWIADNMTVIDSKTVAKALQAQRNANEKMKDENDGIGVLELNDAGTVPVGEAEE